MPHPQGRLPADFPAQLPPVTLRVPSGEGQTGPCLSSPQTDQVTQGLLATARGRSRRCHDGDVVLRRALRGLLGDRLPYCWTPASGKGCERGSHLGVGAKGEGGSRGASESSASGLRFLKGNSSATVM